jgi:esterase/lipase superfamily enzyme
MRNRILTILGVLFAVALVIGYVRFYNSEKKEEQLRYERQTQADEERAREHELAMHADSTAAADSAATESAEYDMAAKEEQLSRVPRRRREATTHREKTHNEPQLDTMNVPAMKGILPQDRMVEVVFGTDRKRVNTNNFDDLFGPSREVQFNETNGYYAGVVSVSIPEDHRTGNIESPKWYTLFNRNDPDEYMLLVGMDTTKAAAFQKLRELMSRSDSSDAFIFVHGFNTTFADAAKRTAQIAYDLSFKGCPMMFSWPSNGKTLQYVSDYDNVDWAIPHLKTFIKDVIRVGQPKKLHLIAHSMGNRLLTNVLKEIEEEHNKILFNQIILAAPDIDASIFKTRIAPKMLKCAKRITMYSSSNDKALKVSRSIRSDYIRIGESGPNIFTINGIETIDASSLADDGYFNLSLNHSYWAEQSAVINDMFILFHDNSAPDKRNLLLVKYPPNVDYWSFKK